MTNHQVRYLNARNELLLDLISSPPGRALDCGCATGGNARILRSRGWRVTGVNNNEAEAALAREFCDEVVCGDLNQALPFAEDASYDLVVLSHVLEHLVDPGILLRDVRRVLRPAGQVAVALPNVAHYRQRVEFLRGRFEYTEAGLMDSTHLRFFTAETARRLLTSNGYQIVTERAGGNTPLWRLGKVLPPDLLTRVERKAVNLVPNVLAGQVLFIACPLNALAPLPRPPKSTETGTAARVRAGVLSP